MSAPWHHVLGAVKGRLDAAYTDPGLTGTCRVAIGRVSSSTALPYQALRLITIPGAPEDSVGGFAGVRAKRLQVTTVDALYGRAVLWRERAEAALVTARRHPTRQALPGGLFDVVFVGDEDVYPDRDAAIPQTNTIFEVAVSLYDLHWQAT